MKSFTDEELTKEKIIDNLTLCSNKINDIVSNLRLLDTSDDKGFNRLLINRISFDLFEFVDGFFDTEIDIYNFFKRRG